MNDKKIIWIINQYGSTPETGVGGRHYYFDKELVTHGVVLNYNSEQY